MNKKEVIELVGNATVPEGATLLEREVGCGVRVARVGQNPGGMSIAMARIFIARLTEDTSDLGDTPDAELLERLHSTSMAYHMEAVEALTIAKLEEALVKGHQNVVSCLRKISAEQGIPYREPDDPFLLD